LIFIFTYVILSIADAAVAELADALDSGSSGSNLVGVQVPFAAPTIYKYQGLEGLFCLLMLKLTDLVVYANPNIFT
jgi:ABC-type proline/glycine betaine transport system permease subunit